MIFSKDDEKLLTEAQKRMERFDLSKTVSQEDVDRELGLEHISFDNAEEVEFE